jgi:hypothetical protein
METDPIVEEIRRNRDEYARKFNYNIRAICRDIRKKQKKAGTQVVKLQPRPAKHIIVE